MLTGIARFFDALGDYTRRLGVCGNAGLIVGAVAGGMLSLLNWAEGGNLVLSGQQAFTVFLLLALFTWLLLIFIFVAFVRAAMTHIVFPALVNAVVVTALTVYLTRLLDLYILAWLIGIIIGILVGYTLCTLYRRVAG